MDEGTKEYIYIGQYSLERGFCKIGITGNLDERLEHYNAHKTGKSKTNEFVYLFTCEVQDMWQVENALKEEFPDLREMSNAEVYFYNEILFNRYVDFIKKHPAFIKEIERKNDDKQTIVKVLKKPSPSLKERGLTRKDLLQNAQKIKNDEFYTRYEDVEKEVEMYDKEIWRDKVIFCNCDDAVDTDERKTSAFALYFMLNFKKIGLKKLICTHYSGGIDLFNQGAKGYIYTYIFTKDGFEGIKEYPKGYNGSFDHPLSLKILDEEADIVCTNPPFSRAIDYWKTIIESEKKFLILSAMTNPITKAFIPYFRNRQVWAGYNRVDNFLNPKKEPVENRAFWYTNLTIKDRPMSKNLKIVPLKDIPEKYKRYDDIGTLLVDKNYIPSDYKHPFAISIFPIFSGILERGYKIIEDDASHIATINGKLRFRRVLVQKIGE